jgi:hypothetical protein
VRPEPRARAGVEVVRAYVVDVVVMTPSLAAYAIHVWAASNGPPAWPLQAAFQDMQRRRDAQEPVPHPRMRDGLSIVVAGGAAVPLVADADGPAVQLVVSAGRSAGPLVGDAGD